MAIPKPSGGEVSKLIEASPVFIGLAARVTVLEHASANVQHDLTQTKNSLLGSYDDSGTKWTPGIREKVEKLNEQVQHVEERAMTMQRIAMWAVGGIWTLVLGIMVEFANSYFGWFGAAKAALQIHTGGH